MIIDAHIHSSPGMGKRVLPLLREECLRNGVSLCLLSSVGVETWPRYPTPKEVRAANGEACELAGLSRGLVRWYAYINPQNSNWRREMDVCALAGAIGFKLWVSLKDKYGRLTNTEKLLDYAGRLKLPVLIHTFNRTDDSLPGEITLPEFTGLARRHPRTRMIAAHAGIRWPAETGLFKRLPNVWADICGCYPLKGQVEAMTKEMGADRILFGSDLCGRSQASQLAKVMLANISKEDKRKIIGQNAVNVFGLKEFSNIKQNKISGSLPPCHSRATIYRDNMESGNPDHVFSTLGSPLKAGDESEDHFCFCGRWPFFETACPNPKALNAVLGKNGIERAYTADLGSIYRQDLAVANQKFLENARGLKRIKPLAAINPRVPNWKPTLEKISPRFAGIILFPCLHNWSLSDPRYADLFRWCRKHDIKLWINCRLDDPRFRHASTVTRDVSAKELLAYGNRPDAPDTVFQGVFAGAMTSFLKRHKKDRRFRFEISRLTDSMGALRAILDKFGNKRLVMGSEYPFRDLRQVRWTSRMV